MDTTIQSSPGIVTEVYPYPGWGIVPQSHRSHIISWQGYEDLTELPEVPGTGTDVLQNFQKFQVLWHRRT